MNKLLKIFLPLRFMKGLLQPMSNSWLVLNDFDQFHCVKKCVRLHIISRNISNNSKSKSKSQSNSKSNSNGKSKSSSSSSWDKIVHLNLNTGSWAYL